jgi:hypothetical protein
MRPRDFQSKIVSLIAISLILGSLLACNLTNMLSKPRMFEGSATEEAGAAFKKKLGGPTKALSLEIESDSATLRAQDPKNPQQVDEYKYFKGLLTGPTPVQLNIMDKYLWFQAQDPKKPDEFNYYKFDLNGVRRDRPVELRSILGPKSDITPEDFLFDLDEAKLAKTPDLAKAARSALTSPTGRSLS